MDFNNLETPYYYYDLALLRRTLDEVKRCTKNNPEFHVHYAVKANFNPRILQTIAAAGLGADCVSGGEVSAAAAAGIPAERIVFAGVGKSDSEIVTALRTGISCFNVESRPELENISELAAKEGVTARVAFRINPNIDAHTHAKITTGLSENKFGLAPEDLLPAIRRAQELPSVEYAGLHFHIGSQIQDLEVFVTLCHYINNLLNELEAAGIVTASVNVGGGLGIDYVHPKENPVPPFEKYFNIFRHELRLPAGCQLHFELGRSIVGQCGTLIARTLYVKEGRSRKFVIVDAGFTELIRPAMYGSHHFTENLTAATRPEAALQPYDVVGPICESSDVFSRDELLPPTLRGDLIAFRSAGAYGEAMASCYNCRPLPKSFFSE